jgi:hypothetical protein
VRDAQTQVNSRKLMSTAEAQYLIWSLKNLWKWAWWCQGEGWQHE